MNFRSRTRKNSIEIYFFTYVNKHIQTIQKYKPIHLFMKYINTNRFSITNTYIDIYKIIVIYTNTISLLIKTNLTTNKQYKLIIYINKNTNTYTNSNCDKIFI